MTETLSSWAPEWGQYRTEVLVNLKWMHTMSRNKPILWCFCCHNIIQHIVIGLSIPMWVLQVILKPPWFVWSRNLPWRKSVPNSHKIQKCSLLQSQQTTIPACPSLSRTGMHYLERKNYEVFSHVEPIYLPVISTHYSEFFSPMQQKHILFHKYPLTSFLGYCLSLKWQFSDTISDSFPSPHPFWIALLTST